MLSDGYRHQMQNKLTHYYIDKISNQDEHHVTIFTNRGTDNALITYRPFSVDNHDDNDGKITPIRDVVIEAIADGGQWVRLINQQFIHQDINGNLNFNFRFDNAITKQGYYQLSKDIKKRFQIKLTREGRLISIVNDRMVNAFVRLIQAIQFINANGHNYVNNTHHFNMK